MSAWSARVYCWRVPELGFNTGVQLLRAGLRRLSLAINEGK